MTTYGIAFLIALIVSVVMTLVVRKAAHGFGWLEQGGGSSRRVHSHAVPRIGGIAIVVSSFAPLLALLVVASGVGVTFKANQAFIVALFGGGVAIAALGLYDDFRGAGATKKFSVQFAVAIGIWLLGIRVELVSHPLAGALPLGFLSLPITVFWVVGIINAMNLIDGLDGLAGGIAFFAVATNFVLALGRGDVLMCLMMASLAGAVLGFLVFNFNPASIFMGDTGSMFLGFVLAISSITTSQKSGTAVALLVPVIALGLPIMDTLLAIGRRALRGRPMFSADKEHIHHRMMSRLAFSHRKAVLSLYCISCVFAAAALALQNANSGQGALVLVAVASVVVVLVRTLGYLQPGATRRLASMREQNLRLRRAGRASASRVRAAKSLAEVWASLTELTATMNVSRTSLVLAEGEVLTSHRELPGDAGGLPPVEISIDGSLSGLKICRLSVVRSGGAGDVDRDEEIALETLVQVIAEAIVRICGSRKTSGQLKPPGPGEDRVSS
jgi:UDP-GlcNAc:undecaprenyl-phosphate GlcNAc-1-phosphate transferase